MYHVAPFGERRADIRAAYQTANLMCANSGREVSDDEFREMVRSLMNYLPCDCDDGEEQADLAALGRLKQDAR